MTGSNIRLRPMQLSDYSRAYELWRQSEGVQLRDADRIDAIARYLERNPELSFIAEINHQLVGTVL